MIKRLAWRGVGRPNAWFHHPRAFWSELWIPNLGLRRQWYMAIHDPVYIGAWVLLLIIIGTVVGLVA